MKLFAGCRRRTVLNYILLQLPGTGLLILVLTILDHWIKLQPLWFWGVLLLWILKEIILFPLTWRAYQGGGEETGQALVGMTGEVVATLNPEGMIEVRGELWNALCSEEEQPLQVGQTVRIIARSGLVLQVILERETRSAVTDPVA